MAERGVGDAWYERWFGEEYLRLYPHRDDEEARSAVRLVLAWSQQQQDDDRVLDLACGAGRHLREFRLAGVRGVGLDLSFALLARARDAGTPVVRGDMRRLPFAAGSFSLVTSFFTSFGYFAHPDEDREVLAEVRRVLRAGGTFAFDFLNADRVRAELRPREERTVDGRHIVQTRALIDEGRVIEKRIEILGPADPLPHIFYERVRLYSAEELRDILGQERLRVFQAYGSYAGDPLTQRSNRVILMGRAI